RRTRRTRFYTDGPRPDTKRPAAEGLATRKRSVPARDQRTRRLRRRGRPARLGQTSGLRCRRRIRSGAVYPSIFEQSLMFDKSELSRVPAFAELPEDQIDWFLSHSEELHLTAGGTYFRQGDPADAMFVILEGQIQGRGEIGGETIVLSTKPGDVTGVLPFSRM